MTKNEIIERINKFPYERTDFWLITGAAMVLYGIKEETADIDMGCNKKMADRLQKEGFLYKYTESGNRWFKVGGDIEIFENWLNDTVTRIDGIPVITLKGMLDMKKELGRDKDFKDIALIKAFMGREN